ncbi:MAG TPA: GNAT family N-acetyltransferase [Candidatus Mcinerneyibacteriales bacterium]|nr:GNAT family N-acetyltransferase [Candidatus Mcinerneyibacteriales bacterium]
MEMRQAKPRELPLITLIYKRAVDEMLSRKIYQWDQIYPNVSFLKKSMEKGELYVFTRQKQVVGAVVLNSDESEEWAPVAWQYSPPALVIHALVMDPSVQGQGLGSAALDWIERFASENKYHSIRLDLFPENTAARNLYLHHEYEYRAEVTFAIKPPGHQVYHCHEKKI